MTAALFVKTEFADSLIADLPNAGLSGVKVHPKIVRVASPDPHEKPEATRFELDWHADKLGIDGMWIGPDDTTFTADGEPLATEPTPEPDPAHHDYDVPLWRDEPQMCRECTEGKHGACNRVALVDDGQDVLEVDCICAEHPGSGS
ncbi:hypothetical protein Q9R08_05025 [Microbacterium sp. QXD-8]|uniref:Uncharacterized protein n=1 Tax=Microbacterium psychrotolerans TaxID=3068321 RepID=A0ABU0YZW9_9MICO|nr:hypothetical protein [Microbacterium sp. QXD-8]MDQ7877335.1 hypothetical protein [Microbacterium sp. QXD-8]